MRIDASQVLPHGISAHIERLGGAREVLPVLLVHTTDVKTDCVFKLVGETRKSKVRQTLDFIGLNAPLKVVDDEGLEPPTLTV